jgi:GTP-binding nuclear protein Ran
MDIKQAKVVFVGNAKVGKTRVWKELTGPFSSNNNNYYVATLGVEVSFLYHNGYTFSIWDCAGEEKYSGLRQGYYIEGNIFFIFHGNEGGFKTPEEWEEDIKSTVENPDIHHIYEEATKEEVISCLDDYIIVKDNNDN